MKRSWEGHKMVIRWSLEGHEKVTSLLSPLSRYPRITTPDIKVVSDQDLNYLPNLIL